MTITRIDPMSFAWISAALYNGLAKAVGGVVLFTE